MQCSTKTFQQVRLKLSVIGTDELERGSPVLDRLFIGASRKGSVRSPRCVVYGLVTLAGEPEVIGQFGQVHIETISTFPLERFGQPCVRVNPARSLESVINYLANQRV
jgi:hypothetical protein